MRIVRSAKEKVYSGISSIPSGKASNQLVQGCLVLEGGAFRGLYTQGMLDYWMLHGINFQTVVGVSAGALAGMNYVAGQIGRSAHANLGFRHYRNYIGAGAVLKAHSPIRVDFLLKDYNRIEKLDTNRLFDASRRFVAVATSCETGEAEFFEHSNCKDMMSAIKASASMPFISPMVEVDGKKCLDGGCACAIPYQWAMDQGYEKIVVIKTRDSSFRNIDPKVNTRAKKLYRNHKALATAIDEADVRYNQQLDELDQLAKEGRIHLIAPSESVTVSRVDGDMEKLGGLYWLGYNDAAKGLKALKNYLGLEQTQENSIRIASENDAQQLVDIYSYYVQNTAITFEYEVPSVEEFKSRIRKTLLKYPYIVYERDGQILGYAYVGTFHDRPAYDWAVETSIYVQKDCKGQGIGKALYEELEKLLKKQNIINLNACIAYPATDDDAHLTKDSVLFHEKLGYKMVGEFHACGYKFDTWYNMVWMEKAISEHEVPAKSVIWFENLEA
ncbi:MAG: GNAT family N-acetyltransferase [Sphaerochaetaceae bacterium]|nr:GNAT family N-acetyltransferase [Sphaerochaetaceae bacterium]